VITKQEKTKQTEFTIEKVRAQKVGHKKPSVQEEAEAQYQKEIEVGQMKALVEEHPIFFAH